jgi:hypothetical protein
MKLLTQPLARLLVLMGLLMLSASSFAQQNTTPTSNVTPTSTTSLSQGACPAHALCEALPGYYKTNNTIFAASVGSYVAVAGATAQIACPTGSTTTAAGQTTCVAAPGFYVSGNSLVACPAGSYSATTGATSCTQAAQAYFVPVAGSSAQTACPNGTSSNGVGAKTCFFNGPYGSCPAGSFINFQNTSNTQCGACPAGTYTSTTMTYSSSIPTPRSCNACAGKTNQVIGSTSCS